MRSVQADQVPLCENGRTNDRIIHDCLLISAPCLFLTASQRVSAGLMPLHLENVLRVSFPLAARMLYREYTPSCSNHPES